VKNVTLRGAESLYARGNADFVT